MIPLNYEGIRLSEPDEPPPEVLEHDLSERKHARNPLLLILCIAILAVFLGLIYWFIFVRTR